MKKFLDLGLQPLANKYLTRKDLRKKRKEQFYHLEVGFDNKTKLVSILNKVPSQKMFDNSYPYRSSMSKTMQKSFKELAKHIKLKMRPKKILEIGSNDGSFLKNFKKSMSIGIEPCANVEKITKKQNFNTIAKYWDTKLAKNILKKHGNFDLIYSANTISHIKDLNDVFKSIDLVLSKNGTFILEDPSLIECLKRNTYDQFYNEHIYVFSLIGIENVLKKHNLKVFNVQNLKIHGGSNRYFIKKINHLTKINPSVKINRDKEIKYGLNKLSSYNSFARRVQKSKKKLKDLFKMIKSKKKTVVGYGVTAKSTTILNYCKIGKNYISYFVDTTLDKQNKYTPGTKIPIYKYESINNKNIDFIFLGAWNFKDEIFKKEKKFIKEGGKFIMHTPYPRII